jgi:hypothetical protein
VGDGPQTAPQIILGGVDYTGIPKDTVFEHVVASVLNEPRYAA